MMRSLDMCPADNPLPARPRILVAGTGGVGGYYGGRLAQAGQDVTFLARGDHASALRAEGLHVQSIKGDFCLYAPVVEHLELLEPFAVVLVCVKSHDTAGMAKLVAPVLKTSGVALSLQNGIENEEILAGILGRARVMGAIAYISSYVHVPGKIIHDDVGWIRIGELDGKRTERVASLAQLFQDAGVECDISTDIQADLWGKLCWNCAFNALTALGRCTVGDLMDNSHLRPLLACVMQEVLDVAQAHGIDMRPGIVADYMRRSEGIKGIETSMLRDVKKGRRLEHEAINGVVVRKGAEVGVATPLNSLLYGLLEEISP